MSCALAAGCLFLDLALGHPAKIAEHNYQHRSLDGEGADAQVVINEYDVPEAIYFDGPIGRIRMGFEHHTTGMVVELEHISYIETTKDNGFNALWVSRKWSF